MAAMKPLPGGKPKKPVYLKDIIQIYGPSPVPTKNVFSVTDALAVLRELLKGKKAAKSKLIAGPTSLTLKKKSIFNRSPKLKELSYASVSSFYQFTSNPGCMVIGMAGRGIPDQYVVFAMSNVENVMQLYKVLQIGQWAPQHNLASVIPPFTPEPHSDFSITSDTTTTSTSSSSSSSSTSISLPESNVAPSLSNKVRLSSNPSQVTSNSKPKLHSTNEPSLSKVSVHISDSSSSLTHSTTSDVVKCVNTCLFVSHPSDQQLVTSSNLISNSVSTLSLENDLNSSEIYIVNYLNSCEDHLSHPASHHQKKKKKRRKRRASCGRQSVPQRVFSVRKRASSKIYRYHNESDSNSDSSSDDDYELETILILATPPASRKNRSSVVPLYFSPTKSYSYVR